MNLKKIIISLVYLLPLTIFAQPAVEVKSRNFSINGYPYAFYTPETKFALGVGGIATFYLGKEIILRPSKIVASAYYTSNNQYLLSLKPEFYFYKNRYFFSAGFDYSYNITKYFGIGGNSPEITNPEFSANIFSLALNFRLPSVLGFAGQSGFLLDYKNYKIIDSMQNPYLVGINKKNKTFGIGYTLVIDSRNNIFFPSTGHFYEIKAQFFMKALGSDFDFNVFTADFRKYFSFENEGILAVQIYGRFARGFPPFYELSALGGQYHMRGYYEGRFRDNDFLMSQVEYRRHIWKKVSGVAFIAVGDVAHRINELSLLNVKFSYGFGVRYLFNKEEKVNLRVDFGFGKNVSGIYFGMEEVF